MIFQSIHVKPGPTGKGRNKEVILLAALASFMAGTTLIWLILDREPPWWDDSFYLAKSLVMFDALSGGVVGYVKEFFSITPNRPPLITLLPTPFYLVFGRDPKYAFGVNLVLIPVLLGSVYLLGKEFWGRRVGLIAAYIVVTMPLINGLTRWYLVEFSLTALVALAICLLTASDDLRDCRKALYLGIVCAAGLLLKVTFALFVLFPLIHIVIRSLSLRESVNPQGDRSSSSLAKTFSALAIPSVLLALPWYIRNFRATLKLVEFAAFSAEGADAYGTGYVFSAGALKRYLLELAGAGTSYYYALLAIVFVALIIGAGRLRSFFRSFGREPLAVLSLWGLPFFVFLFGRNKNLRYVAPLLPAFGLVLGFALDFVLRELRKGQTLLLCLVLTFPAASVIQKSFFVFGDRVWGLNHFLCVGCRWDVARKYERSRWPIEDILDTLFRQTQTRAGKRDTIMMGTDVAYFNADNFQLAAVRRRLPFDLTSSAHAGDEAALLQSLDSASFFIFKEGGEPESPFQNPYSGAVTREVRRNARFVELPYHWVLPDGGIVHVFENLTPWWSIAKKGFVPSGLGSIPNCDVNFDNQVELSGLSFEQSSTVLRVTLRWLCMRTPARDYWCFAHVLDGSGKTVGFLDHPVLGGEPAMQTWRKGDVAVEELKFPVEPSRPHQILGLAVGLYYPPSGQRLAIHSFTVGGIYNASLVDGGTALLLVPPKEKH